MGNSFNKDYRKLEPRKSVSLHGDENPSEDFAETYAVYRFAPERLRKFFPERYAFMRDKIFDRLEYLEDLCSGKRKPVPRRQHPRTRRRNRQGVAE